MTPRELALHLLRQRFGSEPAARNRPPGLAGFQHDAHERLLAAIARYRGALLADGVGLGKTFVAAAVARSLAESGGGAVLAVVPSSLVRMWRRALAGLDHQALVTHAALSRGGPPPDVQPDAHGGLLIVDEAHAFRNPRTRRYAALARLARDRPVLLLSATPINNSVWDLYWLLRLFAADDAFLDAGVPDLAACVEDAHRSGRAGRIPTVLAAVAVRRARTIVAELHGEIRAGGRLLSFPRREAPRPVAYDLPAALAALPARVIAKLELRPWRLAGPSATVPLLRLTLLKRLESSSAALQASLLRLRAALEGCSDALHRGLLPAHTRQTSRPAGDPAQLELSELVLRPLPPGFATGQLLASVAHDLELIDQALAVLSAGAAPDPKLARLLRLLDADLGGRPVLLFTEYRETAEYLWRSLRDRLPCALVHGSGARLGRAPAARRTVIERFSPAANGLRSPPARERVLLLIATDVLAEGLNLQDAADMLSYDLPWNPVRLVQRLGRIDRLGSFHPSVRGWYFVPERQLDLLLGLLRRIRAKLRAAGTTIGLEAPVLARTAPTREIRALAAGDRRALEAAERMAGGLFEIDERLRAAWRRHAPPPGDALAGLPLATDPPAPPTRARNDSTDGSACAIVLPPWLPLQRVARESTAALVFLRWQGFLRGVLVAGARCWEDDVAAGELLLLALDEHAPPATLAPGENPERLAAAAAQRARRWLERPPGHRRGPRNAGRLRNHLLRLLQQHPGGASTAECQRAEDLLARIGGGLDAAAEIALGTLVRGARGKPLAELLAALERHLPPRADGTPHRTLPPARQPPPAETVCGTFLLLPPG